MSNAQKDNKISHVINVGGGGRGSLLFASGSVENWVFSATKILREINFG